MMGDCATDGSTANDRACLEAFIGKWGSRVMRSPLSPVDVAYYAGDAGNTPVNPGAVADVITAILNAPQTLYRVEHGTEDAKAASALSAFEVAARLTYHFWQEPPDDELWTAAENGSLLTAAVYGAQLDRIVKSPRIEVQSTSSSRNGCGSRSCHHSMRSTRTPSSRPSPERSCPPRRRATR